MGRVLLTGTMRCAPHEVDDVVALLDLHRRLSRAEPGCLQFDLWQDELDPSLFHVHEVFRSESDFEAHQTRTRRSDWWRITHAMTRNFTRSPA
nr:putative quinol monooxygenase [uncultured Celeribacter sp.]